jgi:hypothetical protein
MRGCSSSFSHGAIWFWAWLALSNLAILSNIGQNMRFRHVSVDVGVTLVRRRRQFGPLRKALRGTNGLRRSCRPGRRVGRCSRHRVSDLLLLVDGCCVGGACFRCVDDVEHDLDAVRVGGRVDWHDAISAGVRSGHRG